jgi:hypothetical protein
MCVIGGMLCPMVATHAYRLPEGRLGTVILAFAFDICPCQITASPSKTVSTGSVTARRP